MKIPPNTLCAIVLTFNEEIHIRRCLIRALDFCREIYVVDSGSDDRTAEFCRQFPRVHLVYHPWPGNQAQQFNWALQHLPLRDEWILRLDADEYLLPREGERLLHLLKGIPNSVHGLQLQRLRYFLGRHIRHGGTDRIPQLRVFRRGKARCENRLMDEHIILSSGLLLHTDILFADNNLAPLDCWIRKHLDYARREAQTLRETPTDNQHLHQSLQLVRNKKRLYASMPPFWRAAALFCYRYFLRLGFLDGAEGFLWHFLQGWWYRNLVDQHIRSSR